METLFTFVLLISPPWRWPPDWPKHRDGHYKTKFL